MRDEAGWRTQNVGAALASATATFERAVLQATREGEFGWVSQVQLALFRNLDLNGTHLTELAARARITKQSMQELVDQCEATGVVERRLSPRDRRVKIVVFTPKGLRMLEQFREGVVESERRMADALGADFLFEMKARLNGYVGAIETTRAAPPRTELASVDTPPSARRPPEAAPRPIVRARIDVAPDRQPS